MKKKKNMIKEIFIFIILLILVLLVLAVTLYDYIPSNVNIAEVKKYKPDSKTTSIKQEIAYTNGGDISADSDSGNLITSLKSYSIEAADLNVYSTRNFNKGNSNPFDDYYADTETNDKANSSTPSTTSSDDKLNSSTPSTTSSDDKLNSSTPSTTSTDKNNNSSNTTTNDANNSNTDISNSSNGGTVGTFFESPTSK